MLKSDTIKTLLKLVGVAAATFAGQLEQQHLTLQASLVGAVSVVCMLLTVSGLGKDDLVKAAQKGGSLACSALAGHWQTTQPMYAMLALSVGSALAAATVPAPGTKTKIAAARTQAPD